ncbi:hypothetical protein EV174_000289 [Coemansia sp. RSA 2320]|nr:hypothetical protein EV174_000289 [Coemansia sp. RSA 2320]
MAPHLSEDRQCSNMITDLLRESQSGPLPRIMDVAVQLVQGLKRLQLLDTPFARQSFEQHYSDVLSYVGNVMDRIKLVDTTSDADNSAMAMFTDVYQFLIEIIARHTEST